MNQLTELNPVPAAEARFPSDWQSGELLDFLELQRGVDLPVQDRREGTVPIFGSNGLLGFHDVGVSDGPGVITGRSGTIGKVFYSERLYWPLNTSLYVRDFKGNLPKFVYYKLDAVGLERFSTGTGVPTLNRNVVHKEPVVFPPLHEQQKIAAVLTAVDDKLDVIARQIEATQALKQGLMQTLFSRGVGTQDADGRWMPHAEFKDSELGEIPAGWEVVPQVSVATFFNGRAYKLTEWEETGTPVIRLQNLTGSGDKYYYSNLVLPEHQYVLKGDLLFMWSATFGPYIWWGDKAIYHYHIWKIGCSERLDKGFMYYSLLRLTAAMKGKTHGSTMMHLTKAGMEKNPMVLPPIEEQVRIAGVLSSVDSKIELLTTRLSHIQTLKRGLMQKLLTGEWRVKVDAEMAA
jgi:type I restriction enzyme, S subunit